MAHDRDNWLGMRAEVLLRECRTQFRVDLVIHGTDVVGAETNRKGLLDSPQAESQTAA
ncbi:MAG: hypothetical protein IID30_14870 [Planctomycetes bacterium]|nr:hypothetical protein [Planctomycetota bacterium]